MKKILFFINTLNGGGAEKVLVDLVNNLNPEKYQITVQTFLDTGVHKAALKQHVRYKTVAGAKNPLLRRLMTGILINFVPSKLLYNLYLKDDYDCEVAFLEGFPTKVIAASTNKKACKIGWLHTDIISYPDSQNAYRGSFTEKMAYEALDCTACVSAAAKENLIKKYGIPEEKAAVIYNIFDDEDIRQKGAQEIEETVEKPLILSVGRLTEQKGYDGLLRVHKRLMDEGVLHTLWIVGEGDKRPELEAYIQKNQLSNAKLLGFRENPYKYMAKADLFVSSSIAEGFSMVITESVVLGVPVISTNTAAVYEPPEAPRCSVVVQDEQQLYEAIKKALCDRKEQERLREDVRKKQPFFHKAVLLTKTEEFLDNMILEAAKNV